MSNKDKGKLHLIKNRKISADIGHSKIISQLLLSKRIH